MIPIYEQFDNCRLVNHRDFSDTYRCTNCYTKTDVLIEKFSKSVMTNKSQYEEVMFESKNRTLLLSVPLFVKTLDIVRNNGTIWFVTEICDGTRIDGCDGLNTRDVGFLVAKTVGILHEKSIFVGNWNPENIVIRSDNSLRFTNFRDLSKRNMHNVKWMAPESVLSKDKEYDGFIADIWCIGALLYRIETHSDLPYTMFDNKDPDLSAIKDQLLFSLLRGMLTVDPLKRMTIADVLTHNYFRKSIPYPMQFFPIKLSERELQWLEFFSINPEECLEDVRSMFITDNTLVYYTISSTNEDIPQIATRKAEKKPWVERIIVPDRINLKF